MGGFHRFDPRREIELKRGFWGVPPLYPETPENPYFGPYFGGRFWGSKWASWTLVNNIPIPLFLKIFILKTGSLVFVYLMYAAFI